MAETGISIVDALKYMKLMPEVIKIVGGIQVALGPGDGPTKKAAALKAVAAVMAVVEGVAEKDYVNDAAALAIADHLIELAVQMMQFQPAIENLAKQVRALRPQIQQ